MVLELCIKCTTVYEVTSQNVRNNIYLQWKLKNNVRTASVFSNDIPKRSIPDSQLFKP